LQIATRMPESICVVWSVSSVVSDFVRDEAQRALNSGILVPVLVEQLRTA